MPYPTRRSVLTAGLALPVVAAVPRDAPRGPCPPRAGKLLVMGGTRFLGPPIVRRALAAGWEVTLCNRGKSNPGLFADLDHVELDRDTGDLSALQGRQWDACIDTSGYAPLHVEQLCEQLQDQVAHYVFVSTVSVYPDQSAAVVTEDTATSTVSAAEVAAATTIRLGSRNYGPMKAECERVAERVMPGRVTVVRPGLIVGPEDSSDRFTYWPCRVDRGGRVLAPADPHGEVQCIDVRDLGDWCFDLAAARTPGTFHGVGFRGRVSFGELLAGCKITLNTACEFTWVDQEFLLANKVRPYRDLPMWLPAGQRGHFANDRSIANGLRFRSLATTIADTCEWAKTRGADHAWRAGLTADRERELLALFDAR